MTFASGVTVCGGEGCSVRVGVFVLVCACVCVRACVRACVHACVRDNLCLV